MYVIVVYLVCGDSMNWKEFKDKVESHGAYDEMEIMYIDISPQNIKYNDIEVAILLQEDTGEYELSVRSVIERRKDNESNRRTESRIKTSEGIINSV